MVSVLQRQGLQWMACAYQMSRHKRGRRQLLASCFFCWQQEQKYRQARLMAGIYSAVPDYLCQSSCSLMEASSWHCYSYFIHKDIEASGIEWLVNDPEVRRGWVGRPLDQPRSRSGMAALPLRGCRSPCATTASPQLSFQTCSAGRPSCACLHWLCI